MGVVINARLRFLNSGGLSREGALGYESEVVDATSRFDARRQAASLDTGVDELDVIYRTINRNTSMFHMAIKSISPEVGRAVFHAFGEDVAAKRITKQELLDREGVEVGDDTAFGIYTKTEGDEPRSTVYIPTKTIKTMRSRFNDLFARDRSLSKATKLEASVASATWMALGHWVINTLDPRKLMDRSDSGSIADVALGLMIGEAVHEGKEEQDKAMNSVAQAFAGSMAYSGLSYHLQHEDSDTSKYVGKYRDRIRGLFDSGMMTSGGEIDRILARPMSTTKTYEQIETLSPVAEEMLRIGMYGSSKNTDRSADD